MQRSCTDWAEGQPKGGHRRRRPATLIATFRRGLTGKPDPEGPEGWSETRQYATFPFPCRRGAPHRRDPPTWEWNVAAQPKSTGAVPVRDGWNEGSPPPSGVLVRALVPERQHPNSLGRRLLTSELGEQPQRVASACLCTTHTKGRVGCGPRSLGRYVRRPGARDPRTEC